MSIYKLYSVKDLLELKDDPDKWIIKNMIPRMGRVLVYGRGGDYKSAVIFDLCVAVASGGQLLEQMSVINLYGGVVLLSTEGSIYSNRDRLLGYMRSRNVVPDAVRLHYGQQPLELRRPEDIKVLRAMVEIHKPVLVVLDPMVSFYGGNENDTEQMSKFVNGLNSIIADYECAVVIIHHANKKSEMRGSTVLQGWADGVIRFEVQRAVTIKDMPAKSTTGQPDRYDIVTVHAEKQRDGQAGCLFSATPFFNEELGMTTFGVFDSEDARGVILAFLKQEILTYLKKTRAALTKSQVASLFRVGHAKADQALERLWRERLIVPANVVRSTGDGRERGDVTAWKAWELGTRVDGARAILRASTENSDADGAEPS
jgi:hypothetical protein